MKPDVTGVQIAYYFVCHTKLWLFSHRVEMESGHDNVEIGRFIHEERYRRERKNLQLENIKIDFIRKGDIIEVHEIKKTRKMEEAHRFQLLYYLYNLRLKGVKASGVINYPLINRKLDVELTTADTERLNEIIREIMEIVDDEMPSATFRRICRKCAYAEFCFGDMDEE